MFLNFLIIWLACYFGSSIGAQEGNCPRIVSTPNVFVHKKPIQQSQAASDQIALNIEHAVQQYQECCQMQQNHTCNSQAAVIASDLLPYLKAGVTYEMIEVTTPYGIHYKVHNGSLYRQKLCRFPERCVGVEHFLLRIVDTLPNLDFVLRLFDWPEVHFMSGLSGPIFSYSKTKEYLDIMYPSWSFWWSGPTVYSYPYGIIRWDLMRQRLFIAALCTPWHTKQNVAFFRGSRSSTLRDVLIMLSRQRPDLVQAAFTTNPINSTLTDTLNAVPAADASMEQHCQYKYLFNFHGVAASFRFRHLFLCRSLVFHVGDKWLEFFYAQLKPWVHYVPVSSSADESDIAALLMFFREHDDLARGIAERGYMQIRQHLRMQDVQCYWLRLLTEYAKLLRYEVEKDESFIKIPSKELQFYYHIY